MIFYVQSFVKNGVDRYSHIYILLLQDKMLSNSMLFERARQVVEAHINTFKIMKHPVVIKDKITLLKLNFNILSI
jgi:hypothetical protein